MERMEIYREKMNFSFIMTLQGAINLLQVAVGFMALFAGFFIWFDTNLVFQFVFQGYGWQTLILAILFFTWIFAIIMFMGNMLEKDILGQLGKMRLLIIYVICCLLLILSASLESWYCSKVSKELKPDYKGFVHPYAHVWKPRFIAVTVFNWILVATYLVLIPITFFFV